MDLLALAQLVQRLEERKEDAECQANFAGSVKEIMPDFLILSGGFAEGKSESLRIFGIFFS